MAGGRWSSEGKVWSGWDAVCGSYIGRVLGLTFIISTMVLRAIMAMMVYSKGGDTTNCHIRYWKLCLFWGMCLVSGLALIAKSMQALCGRCRSVRGAHSREGGQPFTASLLVQSCPDPLLCWAQLGSLQSLRPLIKPDSSIVYCNSGSHHTCPASPRISLASNFLQYQLADVENQFIEAGLEA